MPRRRAFSDEGLRAMYPGGKAGPAARRMARLWAVVLRLGLLPRRWVTLEVVGRRSGERRRFPLGMADVAGEWYVVSMLGECNWVRNVRAAGGLVTIWHGHATACRLDEVPVEQRAPVLRRYVEKVPGGRPHVLVERAAPLSAFAAVAPRHPVFRVVPVESAVRSRRHWTRRILVAVLVVVMALFVAAALSVKLQSTPAPLALPAAAAAPRGPLAGTWRVAGGSAAGFRLPETVAFLTGTVVGRTNAVSGSVLLRRDDVVTATLDVRLTSLRVGGRAESQLATSLGTTTQPIAVVRLSAPVSLGPAFVAGETASSVVRGSLSLHGTTHAVTITFSGRRSGTRIEVAGAMPIVLSDWGIVGPAGFGPLGSLADHGVAEFLLVLRRA